VAHWLGIGPRRIELARCGSTNDEAARLARQGAEHGTVVLADAQSACRGRLARQWHSPPGENLYLSCLLRPELAPPAVPPITLAAGVGVCEAVNSLGVSASLKWPNDVLVGGRKLAGILTEMSTQGTGVEHAIVGIGVNLNTTEFPPELTDIATSLRIQLGGQPVDRPVFTDALLRALEGWFDRFLTGGVPAIASAWTERAEVGARAVRATAEGAVIEGRAVGLDADGALLVEEASGRVHRVVAGDVELLP